MASVSFAKVMQVLELVQESGSGLSFEEISARIDAPRSTLYRYLKALADSGLLVSLPNSGFSLGPRIAELDYKMRRHDRLIVLSRPVMAELVQDEVAVALLCRLYRSKVLCIHQESHRDALHSHYERGLARPLLRGAASRVILAHMPARIVARLYQERPDEFAGAGLGKTIDEVKRSLRAIRLTGWDAVAGQVTVGATGIAAPIFDGSGHVLGSLSLTLKGTNIAPPELKRIAARLAAGAAYVTNAIAGGDPALPHAHRGDRREAAPV